MRLLISGRGFEPLLLGFTAFFTSQQVSQFPAVSLDLRFANCSRCVACTDVGLCSALQRIVRPRSSVAQLVSAIWLFNRKDGGSSHPGMKESFPCHSAMCPQTSEFNLRGTCPLTKRSYPPLRAHSFFSCLLSKKTEGGR